MKSIRSCLQLCDKRLSEILLSPLQSISLDIMFYSCRWAQQGNNEAQLSQQYNDRSVIRATDQQPAELLRHIPLAASLWLHSVTAAPCSAAVLPGTRTNPDAAHKTVHKSLAK